ncbi:hypothetical protein AHF37_07089 [Paragonimus kellicotti]|nr:hypothetical protein AHF37_07089 [Paragonimus kellicotti]
MQNNVQFCGSQLNTGTWETRTTRKLMRRSFMCLTAKVSMLMCCFHFDHCLMGISQFVYSDGISFVLDKTEIKPVVL